MKIRGTTARRQATGAGVVKTDTPLSLCGPACFVSFCAACVQATVATEWPCFQLCGERSTPDGRHVCVAVDAVVGRWRLGTGLDCVRDVGAKKQMAASEMIRRRIDRSELWGPGQPRPLLLLPI